MREFVLTLPDQKAASEITRGKSTNGQGDLMKLMSREPLAQSELGRPKGRDHIHLGQFDGTDYVQWWGRCADGFHRPIGRIMKICRIASIPPQSCADEAGGRT